MTELPDSDSPIFRLLVLRGRQQALTEIFHAVADQFEAIDGEAPIDELVVDYSRGVRNLSTWLFEQAREANLEVSMLATELGIDLPSEG